MNSDFRGIWGSYLCFFTRYQVTIYNFTYSPLSDLIMANAGIDTQTLLMLINLALGISVLGSFILLSGRDLQRNRALWSAMYLLDFGALLLIPVVNRYPHRAG